ncbi:response regulator transcription factor [Bradyrhizobium prioriisuperbiae]|uniref:response regulator transcription factor n=1 Tax=Bradyrhizobium prioriisuperbiae TaxID=2854389 RepID=UPI0028E5A36B|nr:response regulator transcription factor [Bradyrhizobium prioritasuperba]
MRILVVEDEPEIASLLRTALERQDIVVDHVVLLADAEEAARRGVHDAIILDRRLPDGDGLTLVPRLRSLGVAIPVIVLTARRDLPDRIEGLNCGADDYLTKPFALEELLARLRTVLRRAAGLGVNEVRFGTLTFNLHHRAASVANSPVHLSRRELLVLETLIRRGGRTVSRSVLEEAVYGFQEEIQPNAIDPHVSRLRRKLTEAGAAVEIRSVRGIGYLLRQLP